MLDFEYYFMLLYIFMAIVAFFVIILKPNKKINSSLVIIFGIFWLLLFGNRHFDVGSDTNAYLYEYDAFLSNAKNYSFSDYKDIGLFVFMFLVSKISASERFFIFCFDLLYLFPLILVFQKIKLQNLFLLFFSFCSFFFFKTMGVNIMRQGVAISFFLLGVMQLFEGNTIKAYFLYLISFLFHGSIIIAIIIFFLSKKIKNIKIPLLFYVCSIVLSFFGFGFNTLVDKLPFLNFLLDKRIQGYFNATDVEYNVGFRTSFILFNTIFAFIGLYFGYKKVIDSLPNYSKILSTYLILSGLFFLMFTLPYSDRLGLLSWIFIPFLLMPYLEMQNRNFSLAILYALSVFVFVFFNVKIF